LFRWFRPTITGILFLFGFIRSERPILMCGLLGKVENIDIGEEEILEFFKVLRGGNVP